MNKLIWIIIDTILVLVIVYIFAMSYVIYKQVTKPMPSPKVECICCERCEKK